MNYSSVIFYLFGKFVDNKKILLQMNLPAEQTHKKKLSASFRRYIPRKILSVIPLVII
jgi:hypothetical protein